MYITTLTVLVAINVVWLNVLKFILVSHHLAKCSDDRPQPTPVPTPFLDDRPNKGVMLLPPSNFSWNYALSRMFLGNSFFCHSPRHPELFWSRHTQDLVDGPGPCCRSDTADKHFRWRCKSMWLKVLVTLWEITPHCISLPCQNW